MLKQLMISKKIEQRKAALAGLEEQEKGLETRAEQVEAALAEAQTDEEIAAVEEEVGKIEAEKEELKQKKAGLEAEIAELEGELEQLNSKEPKNSQKRSLAKPQVQGGDYMIKRGFFQGMSRSAVENLIVREDVKDFIQNVRTLIGQKRAVTGGDLLIPDVLLGLLRDNLHRYSKLTSKVNLRRVSGTARQNIVGAIPEGIWTEMVGALNEMNIVFNQLEVDGYKVGGYVAIPNSILEDSDINLAGEVLDAISQGIGLALDKAILYGTGNKMPVGIVTRLAEVQQPAYWGQNERTWTNLSASNLLAIDSAAQTPSQFFADLIMKLGVVQANYSDGQLFWAMNTQTYRILQSKAINFNAAGAVVSGVQNAMPVIGGEVVLLDFILNNHIIGGYGSLYLLAERAGVQLAQSEHVQFIEDNTVFKGTARYDGRPIFGEAFVGITIDQGDNPQVPDPSDVVFAPDSANPSNPSNPSNP